MKFNTIILIDKNQEEKNIFMEKLKRKMNFSYTKLEAIFQTIRETAEIGDYNFEAQKYIEFLNKFLNNISTKDEMYLIDIDNLSTQNANKLITEHDNIIIIYLQKIQNEEKAISVDIYNENEVEKLIEEIVKRKRV